MIFPQNCCIYAHTICTFSEFGDLGFGEMAGHQTWSTFEILRYSGAECHSFINGSMR